MQSLAYIPGSDESGNASLMTVQNDRSPGATTIQVNTVSGAPAKFYGTMGTPHTFTDPVTSETITIVSEATAVDFAGHIDGGNVEIDVIAPGYTDIGSEVGDIIVIRPITEWANNIFNVLSEAHEDDGKLKPNSVHNTAVLTDAIVTNAKLSTSSGEPGAVSTWVPTFTNLSGGTLNFARYVKIGKRISFELRYALAGAGVSGSVSFSLPAPANANGLLAPAVYSDTGSSAYAGFAQTIDGINGTLYVLGTASTYAQLNATLSSTVPHTWANTDVIQVVGTYITP